MVCMPYIVVVVVDVEVAMMHFGSRCHYQVAILAQNRHWKSLCLAAAVAKNFELVFEFRVAFSYPPPHPCVVVTPLARYMHLL